jgi:hypothetical protein
MPDCPCLFISSCTAAVSIELKTKGPDLGLFWAGRATARQGM